MSYVYLLNVHLLVRFYLEVTSKSKFKLNQYVSEVQWLDAVSQFTKVIELKKHVEKSNSMPMPYSIEHDMSAFQGSSIMAIYVQTVASYIFKHILLKVYKAQCDQKRSRL